jgi:hypothetical protein
MFPPPTGDSTGASGHEHQRHGSRPLPRPKSTDRRSLVVVPPPVPTSFSRDRAGGHRIGGICVHQLTTGQPQWFDARASGQAWYATIFSDHAAVADNVDDDHSVAVVPVIDVATGPTRPLWNGFGGHRGGSAVTQSPDGRLTAATDTTEDPGSTDQVVDWCAKTRVELGKRHSTW